MIPFIAAFDLATATGVADSGGPNSDRPRLFTWHLDDAGSSRPARLGYLWRLCDKYFETHKVEVVIYEKPLHIGAIASMMAQKKFITTEDVLGMLRGSIGVLEACAAHHGIADIRMMDIKDARKHLTGQRTFPDGNAKAATMRAAKSLGWDPENEDESDAAALWSLAVGQSNPRMANLTRAHLEAKDTVLQPKKRRGRAQAGTLFDQG